MKYIPAEVVATYTMLFTLLVSLKIEDDVRPLVAGGLIIFFFLITIAYIARNATPGPVRQAHLVVSPIAFLAWAYPISSAMLGEVYFQPLIAFAVQAAVIGLSIYIKPRED